MAEIDQTLATDEKPSKALAPGAQLGRFTLRRMLGEGGMGMVWAAHDPDLDREIAIKVLRQHAVASDGMRKRLLREARAMGRLKHPNVLTVYEVGTSGETDFIAMELVDGVTVDEWLLQGPPDNDIWNAIMAAGRGLAAAHAAGLVHRDFKPHNVLRSRDGRVLVTDFGLARGLGEEPPERATKKELPSSPIALDETLDAPNAWEKINSKPVSGSGGSTPRADSVLDSPLTQTGAMIGTPAYMAPEQFHGAPPDPRTDQFAYCVTAWQALTGARPFSGETLEELRRSASGGVDHVQCNLPKDVRAVLARGLSRDPAERWPGLGDLLDALETTRKPARRIWPYALSGAVVVAAIVFALVVAREKKHQVIATCEPADKVFAEAALDRDDLTGSTGAVNRIAHAFEQFRTKWTASYQEACNAAPSKTVDARLACLRGARDEAAALRAMLHSADPRVLDVVDVHGMLPNFAVCNGPTPVALPEIPRDQPRRGNILAIMARGIALDGVAREDRVEAVDKLIDDATATGWRPLVPITLVAAGNMFLRAHDGKHAREMFGHVGTDDDVRFQAMAHLGLLEASMHELAKPGFGDTRPKPGALHEELARQLTYARSAIRAAGNDPMLAGSVALLEAEARAGAGLWTHYRQPYKLALELATEAREEFKKAGDARRAAEAAALEGWIDLWRGNDRALDDAVFVARTAEESLDDQHVFALDELRARIASAKGDFIEAHRRYESFGAPALPAAMAPTITGKVVDRTGKPVAGANVVAWTGELDGDPLRAYTDPRFTGELVMTAADGTFTAHGTAVIAETQTARSAPTKAADKVVLFLDPRTTASGAIEGEHGPLVDAIARFTVGDATWNLHAPLAKDGSFQLAGLPKGAYAIGATGPAGHGTRRVIGTKWPTGAPIELVLRSPDDSALAYIVRGKIDPKTRKDLDALVARAPDVATASFHRIGADATEAGREIYEQGDQHAIVIGNPPGEVTACVLTGDAVYCSSLTIEADTKDSPNVHPILFKTN